MSDQQEILPCVVCDQPHEQMLMLSCLHDPCINCAAIHYVENAPKNSLYYPCSRCNEQTQLDTSSVVELQRVYRSLKPSYQETKKYNYNRNISKENKQMGNMNVNKNSRSRLHDNNNQVDMYGYGNNVNNEKYQKYGSSSNLEKYQPNYYKAEKPYYPTTTVGHVPSIGTKKTLLAGNSSSSTLMCNEHPEDELTYFCFSCNKPICPQCAIHGAHKQHEVQTTRRAIKQIKGRLVEVNQKLSGEIGLLMHRKQESRKNLKQLADGHKRDHDEIKKQFNKLRNILIEKEKQFLNIVTDNYERNCEETKHSTLSLDKMIESYNTIRKNIDVTLKRDDLTVLQEFNRRQDEAQDILQRNGSLSQESQVKIGKQVDYRSFEEELSQIVGMFEGMRLQFNGSKGEY